ncbi:unnamed protein product [Acanthosepion pharaonis]|uniref:Uncharacterized protein n=1 Tax=Acanthosepion pharaonis TaxID=158019 RepID=A0A812EVR7_ACAPH|nr:unnamed protein product [Sepia pharaonis]
MIRDFRYSFCLGVFLGFFFSFSFFFLFFFFLFIFLFFSLFVFSFLSFFFIFPIFLLFFFSFLLFFLFSFLLFFFSFVISFFIFFFFSFLFFFSFVSFFFIFPIFLLFSFLFVFSFSSFFFSFFISFFFFSYFLFSVIFHFFFFFLLFLFFTSGHISISPYFPDTPCETYPPLFSEQFNIPGMWLAPAWAHQIQAQVYLDTNTCKRSPPPLPSLLNRHSPISFAFPFYYGPLLSLMRPPRSLSHSSPVTPPPHTHSTIPLPYAVVRSHDLVAGRARTLDERDQSEGATSSEDTSRRGKEMTSF